MIKLKELENFVYTSYIKDFIQDYIKLYNNSHYYRNKKEKKEAFRNTLYLIDFNLTLSQVKIFYRLIEFDKIGYIKDLKIFVKLFNFINSLKSHIETLEELYNLEDKLLHEKGIARTPYTKVDSAITPRINHINENIKYNPTKSNELQSKIYKEFQKNPLEIDAMYSIISHFDKSIFKNENSEVLDTLYNQRKYLNSAVKLEDYHIYISCQIYCFSIYKKNSLFNQDLKIRKRISNNKIASYIDTIVKSFFDEVFDKPLTRHHINKTIQIKCFFNNIPILEYRTKSNYKKHPIFENV